MGQRLSNEKLPFVSQEAKLLLVNLSLTAQILVSAGAFLGYLNILSTPNNVLVTL